MAEADVKTSNKINTRKDKTRLIIYDIARNTYL